MRIKIRWERTKPNMGTIMSGLLPFESDQGPRKRQKMMPGMVPRMVVYMLMLVTTAWTAISCSLWMERLEQMDSVKRRLFRQAFSIRRF